MRISLSPFDNEYLEALAICGTIRGGDLETLISLLPEKPNPLVTVRHSSRGPVCFRLIVNKATKVKGGVHFHVDTATDGSFDGDKPMTSGSEDQIDRLFEAAAGHPIDFCSQSRFVAPRHLLRKHSVVNLLLGVSVGQSGGEASLDGAEYKIKSGPIDRLQWRLLERDGVEFVKSRATSESSGVIDSDILANVYEPMWGMFRALILEDGVQ